MCIRDRSSATRGGASMPRKRRRCSTRCLGVLAATVLPRSANRRAATSQSVQRHCTPPPVCPWRRRAPRRGAARAIGAERA
eukprot:6859665-Alexandrium_andersonii.AAC.1